MSEVPTSLSITPIGFIRTSMRTKFDTPHQPTDGIEQHNTIELNRQSGFEVALRDLQGFDRIWLIWWSHKNSTWRPLVLPPRGQGIRRGVFATRSPHRPNPICITAVPLIKIEKLTLTIGNTDLLDGTPILDIKPYIPTIDSFSDSSVGWIAEMEKQLSIPPSYSVTIGEPAQTQLTWLKDTWQIDFLPRLKEILERDPTPHRTRRIVKAKRGGSRISCGGWRVYFDSAEKNVTLTALEPSFPRRLLEIDEYQDIPDKQAQIEFGKIWGELK